jgi:hypothetical protein
MLRNTGLFGNAKVETGGMAAERSIQLLLGIHAFLRRVHYSALYTV